MFVDLVGSTQLSYHMDPEDLGEIILKYQETVSETVLRYGGYIARYSGDGVLAYFCWPHAREDQAERAVRAGLTCIEAVSQLKLDQDQTLQTRVGIATGRVVVGETALELNAVVGETPNLAARLQSIADPDCVVIEPLTRRLIGDAFELSDLGKQRFKGIVDPVSSWCVVKERNLDSRFSAAHTRGITPLVGRQKELGRLLGRWDQIREGHGQVVLLSGEAGMGKSRIVRELQETVTPDQHECLHFQCSPLHGNSAFYPVVQHIEQAAGVVSNDTPELKLEKLELLLADLSADKGMNVPLIAALMGLPWRKQYPSVDIQSRQLKQQTIQALTTYILSATNYSPTLLIFEDVHWIDPSSLELLDKVIGEVKLVPVLLVVTSRLGCRADWKRRGHVETVSVERLNMLHAASVVRAAGRSVLKEDTVAQIVARADGVPLFLEELTHAVIESDDRIDDIDIPVTLQALLAERLDRLDEARDVASVGSVIGRSFSYSTLLSLMDLPVEELSSRLDQLVASGLILSSGFAPNSVYTFKHSLVQDTAYKNLLKVRRRQLHNRIGSMLEEQAPETVKTEPELLAHHFELGQELTKALCYWIEAGDRAVSIPAPSEAKSHYWRALEILQRRPDSGETRRRLMRTVISLIKVSYDIGGSIWRSEEEQRKTHSLIEAAIETAKEIGDQVALALLEADQAGRLYDEKLYAKALRRAKSIEDRLLQANIAFRYSGFLGRSGKYEASQSHSKAAIGLLCQFGDDVQRGMAMIGAARCYTARAGNFVDSLRYAKEARKIADLTGDPQIKSWLAMEAEPYLYKGNWQSAVDSVEEHLPAAWQIGNWQVVLFASAWATIAYIKLGRLDKAKAMIEQALDGADDLVGYNFPRTVVRLALSQLHVELGNLDDARSAVDWSLDSALSHNHHLEYGAALRTLAQIHEKDGDKSSADRQYLSSMEVLGGIQSRPELAQTLLAYGQYKLEQDSHEGRRLLNLALEHFQDINATGWIEETRTVLMRG